MTSKILVADDSITIQKIVAMAFENEDATVEGVSNGKDAFDKLKKFKPDIVLADVEMPGLNGFELSRKIKESAELSSISVLLLASDFEEFEEDLFRDSRADDHITKPFKSEDIVRKVNDLLQGVPGFALDAGDDDAEEEVIALSEADMVADEPVFELGEDNLVSQDEDVSALDEEEVDLAHDRDEENNAGEGLGFAGDEGEEEANEFASPGFSGSQDSDLEEFLQSAEEDIFAAAELETEDEAPESPFDASRQEMPELENSLDDADDVMEESLGIGFDSMSADMMELKAAEKEETLDELVGKVEALSKKAEEIQAIGSAEKLSPLEAIDEVIREVQALREFSSAATGEKNGSSGKGSAKDRRMDEVRYVSEENAEELEDVFDEMTQGRNQHIPTFSQRAQSSWQPFSGKETILPEPEDLLGDLTIHHFSTPGENPMPDLEKDIHSFVEDRPEKEAIADEVQRFPVNPEPIAGDEEPFSVLMGQEIRKILEKSLDSSLEKEISGLSEKIVQTVEHVVREITPGIARSIIEKEIDKIRRMDDA